MLEARGTLNRQPRSRVRPRSSAWLRSKSWRLQGVTSELGQSYHGHQSSLMRTAAHRPS